MTQVAPFALATEGSDDLVVARRLVEFTGHSVGPGPGAHDGAPALDAALPGYRKAAQHVPWFVLRDLDQHVCAPGLVERIAPHRPPQMLVRIVVRAIESWFFADAESLAMFLSVPRSKVPRNPDEDPWPKRSMVNLARLSRSREIRRDMVPSEGSQRYYGAGYAACMVEYAERHWRPEIARTVSPSLERAIKALERLRTVR